ncbi:MAG: hypothetical protein J0L72_01075 [Armatimonadetes bacterium]|nr:hypothetical protein [Armatimonadota bacterium]
MNKTLKLGFASLGIAGLAAASMAAQTFTITGLNTGGLPGDPDNGTTTQAAVGATFNVGTISVASGAATSLIAGTYSSEASVGVSNSGYPGYFSYFSPFPGTTYVTTTTVNPAPALNGTMVGMPMVAGTTYTFEGIETYDDGVGADSSIDSLTFTINDGTAPVPPTFGTLAMTFNIPGPVNSMDVVDDPDNIVLSGFTNASAFIVNAQVKVNSGSFSNTATTSWPSEASFRLVCDAFPTSNLNVAPFAGFVSPVPTLVLTAPGIPRAVTATGTLLGAAVPAAANWTAQSYESFDDVADSADAAVSNVNFQLTGLSAAAFHTIPGTKDAVGSLGDPANASGTLGTVGTSYILGSQAVLSGGTLDFVAAESFGTEARIRLRNSAYPFFNCDFPLATSSTIGALSGLVNTYGLAPQTSGAGAPNGVQPANAGSAYNMAGLSIPSGSTWTYEIYESYDDVAGADETLSNISFGLIAGPAYVPVAPPTATDLGDINSDTASEATPLSFATGTDSVKWYKFTLSGSVASDTSNFLDIWTTAGGNDDSELALFDSAGRMLVTDDDDDDGFLSLLSVGNAAAPRAANGVGTPFRGRDLDGMAAGTYYLATAGYNAAFANGFSATTTSSEFGGFIVNFRTNLPVSGYTVAGNLELQDTLNGLGNETIAWTATNGVVNASGSVTVDGDMGGGYSINLPSSMTGSVTLKFKGGTFLAKTISFTGGSNLTGQDASCMNGDIDQDGEVGSTDFDAVVANFGNTGPEDCDNDGEVGASDFDIVVANFGEGDN